MQGVRFNFTICHIEKIDKNHQYYFGYTIKSTNSMVLTIRYDMIIKLNKNSIKTSNFEVIDFSMKFVN
ncbi:hypothetical protein EFN36_03530 [Leuconostoc mesenteroides]|nr:hypothetical protein [Leuconostoc mesenteroides]